MTIRVLLILALSVFAISCAKPAESGNVANSNESQDNRAEGTKRSERKARKAIEEHLKNQNPSVTEVKLDLLYTNPQVPNKAYASVTVTYAGNANEKARREFQAFFLVKEGDDWVLAEGNNPAYTNNPQQADQYLMASR